MPKNKRRCYYFNEEEQGSKNEVAISSLSYWNFVFIA